MKEFKFTIDNFNLSGDFLREIFKSIHYNGEYDFSEYVDIDNKSTYTINFYIDDDQIYNQIVNKLKENYPLIF